MLANHLLSSCLETTIVPLIDAILGGIFVVAVKRGRTQCVMIPKGGLEQSPLEVDKVSMSPWLSWSLPPFSTYFCLFVPWPHCTLSF